MPGGRPPQISGPILAVSVDGRGAAWCDGIFSGDREIVAFAKRAVRYNATTDLLGTRIMADDTSAVGAYAALASYRPGRTIVAQAPAEVIETLGALSAAHNATPWSV